MSSRLGLLRYSWRALRAEAARLEQLEQLERRFPTARFDEGVAVVSPHLLELGADVLVQRNTLLHCGGLEWSFGAGGIELGDRTTVAHNCVLLGAGGIRLGADVSIAQACLIFSSQDRFESGAQGRGAAHDFAAVVIEDGARVFSASIVSPGVTIGRGAVIGAHSLVRDDVPPMELWAGVPARKLRTIDPNQWLAPRRQGIDPGSISPGEPERLGS
jgi:acetyltransferase-like isoleucine patch superfamily enzyme